MGSPCTRADRCALVVAMAFALAAAACQYALFLPHAHELWTDPLHDRNAHYFFGLSLALDAANGDAIGFVHDVNNARVWPPLHGLLLASVLTVTGFDPAFAVLPSLIAWAGLLVGVFVLARRLAPARGNLAGFTALLLTLASPAHRAFATDVMLESLGTCLSIWALERYVALRQTPSAGTGRGLALVLLALLLTKLNYWVLIVAGLLATEVATRPGVLRALRETTRRMSSDVSWRDPLVLSALLALLGAVVLTILAPLRLGPVKINHGGDLATLAVLLLLVRVLLWRYRERGRALWPTLVPEGRSLLTWGMLPAAIWFALPGRIAAFLWLGFLAHGEAPDYSLVSRALKLASWLQTEYHAQQGLPVLLVLVLAGLALVYLRRLRPGTAVLFVFLLTAGLLTWKHPNCKARFLMNWLPALWVLAGIGLAILGRRRMIAFAGLVLVAVLCLPAAVVPGATEEAGPRPGAPSLLRLAKAYLPHLQRGDRTVILATVPMKFFTQASYLQECRPTRDRNLEGRGWLYLETPDLDAFRAWLERSHCDTVVLLDCESSSPFNARPPGWTGDAVLAQWRATQQFTMSDTVAVPEVGTTVRIFRRSTLAQR
jgi:hypothetical protein